MTVSLTANFLASARGLTFTDGGGATWAFNSNTNSMSITVTGSGPSAANPTAKVGTAAINGAAATFMRSDAAPAINLTANYSWTGAHTFTPATGGVIVNGLGGGTQTSLTVNSGLSATAASSDLLVNRAGSTANAVLEGANVVLVDTSGSTTYSVVQQSGGQTEFWQFNGSWTQVAKFLTTHGMQLAGPLGVNGATPPAQVTGFGTPTSASVVSNFSGSAATTAQMQATIAQILAILKANGMIGA